MLTKRQKQILDYVSEFITRYGYAPSTREIATHFGLSSTATVHEHICNLKKLGYIHSYRKKPRSLKLSYKFLKCELHINDIINASKKLNTIHHNNIHHNAIHHIEYKLISSWMVRKGSNPFIIEIKGNCMAKDGILDGDYIIAESNSDPKNGDIIVVLENKRNILLTKHGFMLGHTWSKRHKEKPKYTKDRVILGVARTVLRRL